MGQFSGFTSSGQVVAQGNLPLSALRSPKTAIDVNTPSLMQRWLNVLNGTRAGDALPPIRVQPGQQGTPLPLVDFRFEGP